MSKFLDRYEFLLLMAIAGFIGGQVNRDGWLPGVLGFVALAMAFRAGCICPSRRTDAITAEEALARQTGGHGARQRRKARSRGEGPCMDCGTLDTPVWSAPNDLWNLVVGSPYGFLCPWCFVVRAEAVVGLQVWDIRPRSEGGQP